VFFLYAQASGFAHPGRRAEFVGTSVTTSFAEILTALMARRDLSERQMRCFFAEMMAGQAGEAEAAAFLVALHMKGPTSAEVAAAARVLREHMRAWDPGVEGALDTCGTGGDGRGTFNISTAAALVAAAAGVPVVKHGNRSSSGNGTGSADVLARLGVSLEFDPDHARRCLQRVGLAFCFAPHFHPAMRHVIPVRKRLGVPTLFNCLGPLVNPAATPYQLLGVGRPEWLDLLAGALAELGTRRAFLVCGRDGLDEVSLSGPTLVREVRGGRVTMHEWTPADFGLDSCELRELCVAGPDASAAMLRAVLSNEGGAPRRVVLANAAAALLAAERVDSLREGVSRAAEELAGGGAWRVLEALVGH
jgi:anthranilate phosphoribosyltransferase